MCVRPADGVRGFKITHLCGLMVVVRIAVEKKNNN